MKRFLRENLVIIIIVLVFIIGMVIFGFILINTMNKSQKSIQKQVDYVDVQYQKFSEDSSVISEKRTKIYNEMFNNAYYVDFQAKDEEWKKIFEDYYGLIDKLHDNYIEVLKVCSSYNFIYDSTKQRCNSINKYYEIMLNNYSIDYKLYNDVIEKYNTWTESNTSYSKLETFKKEKYLEQKDYNDNKEIEHY